MFLTLFLACPLLLVACYLGLSSLRFGMKFGEWIHQPKAIAFWICIALCVLIICSDLSSFLS